MEQVVTSIGGRQRKEIHDGRRKTGERERQDRQKALERDRQDRQKALKISVLRDLISDAKEEGNMVKLARLQGELEDAVLDSD